MKDTNLYVAKVNVNQNIFNSEENVKKIINDLIPKQIIAYTNDYKGKYISEIADDGSEIRWTLADTTYVNKNIITGNLTKSIPLQYESIDEENRTVEKKPEDEFETKSAFFVYFIDIEKLCFKTSSFINRNVFIKKFKKLLEFEKGLVNIGEVEILLVTESSEVRDILLNKKVTEIKIEVIQPNGRKKQYESMRAIISQSKSKKTQFTLQNNDGLQVKEDNTDELSAILAEGLDMTEEGYGSMSVSYFEGKKIKKSSTESSPVIVGAALGPEDLEVPESVILDLQSKLREREKS